jgi:hypothetical protein
VSVKKRSLALFAMAPCLCAGSVLADPIGDDRLRPGIYPTAPLADTLATFDEPEGPLDLSWSIGLRGTQISSNQGNSFALRLRPELELRSLGTIADTLITGHVEIARSDRDDITPTHAALKATLSSQIGADSRAQGTAEISFGRELRGTPGIDAQVIRPADITAANIGGSFDHRMGRFNLGLAGAVDRIVYGETERRDTGVTNNGDQNYWKADTNLRVGYQITPVFEVYGEGQLGRYWFDQASRTSGVFADAYTRSVKAGVSGDWQDVVSAHAAVGVGQYLFTDSTQPEITTRLYEAGITYRPDPTLGLTAQVETTIEPTGADNSGAVRVLNKGQLTANYQVNTSLGVRASAELSRSEVVGSSEVEDRRGAGVGADYGVTNRTKLSADYNYAHRTNSATGTFDSHQLSVGVTLKR